MNPIILHHVNFVGDRQIFAGTANDQNGRNPKGIVELAYTVGKRGDGFLFNQFFHHTVSYHKVGCASVLIHKQQLCSAVYGFHDIGRLTGRARRMLGGKIASISSRQPFDKRGNVEAFNASSVLSRYRDGAFLGYAKFASVAGPVIVNAGRNGIE